MTFFDNLKQRAREGPKVKIILPEYITEQKKIASTDLNIEDAILKEVANKANAEGIAEVVLLTQEMLSDESLVNELATNYAKKRGFSYDTAKIVLKKPCIFGAEMVASGHADGAVMGKYHKTFTVISATKLCIGEADKQIMSTISFFELPEGIGLPTFLAYADVAINIDPNSEELAKIIATSAATYRTLVEEEPVICLASHETKTGSGRYIKRAQEALSIYLSNYNPQEKIDGPCQLDAAFKEKTAASKGAVFYKEGWGAPNLVIFTNLDSANTNYKALKLISDSSGLRNMLCTQGSRLPIDDLSRGDGVNQILYTIAANAIKAQQFRKSV